MDLTPSQHLTPPDMAARFAADGIVGQLNWPEEAVVYDPACGDGRLLQAVWGLLSGQHRSRTRFIGMDLDPAMVKLAREKVPFAEIIEGDALFDDLPGEFFTMCIMNPPFGGSTAIGKMLGPDYRKRLKKQFPLAKGQVDLSAFFLSRMADFAQAESTISIIAPNTIAQGASRRAALQPLLVEGGWAIYTAHRTIEWPGRASVTVSAVHMRLGMWPYSCTLTG